MGISCWVCMISCTYSQFKKALLFKIFFSFSLSLSVEVKHLWIYIYINIYINKVIKNIKYNIVCASDSGDILLIVKSEVALLPWCQEICPLGSGRAGHPLGVLLLVCKGLHLLHRYFGSPPNPPVNPCRLPECDTKVICRQGMLFLAR